MGLFKSLRDKVTKKKQELEQDAMERAAKAALEQTAAAAKTAVVGAGKRIGAALFGPEDPDAADATRAPAVKESPLVVEARRAEQRKAAAAERARKDQSVANAARAADREIDDELAALKRKIKPTR